MSEIECFVVVEAKTGNWMTPIIQYLEDNTYKPEEEKSMKQKCARYTLINEDLYRRGYSATLLKCITSKQAEYVLTEIHEGVCEHHSGARMMASKVLRAGYYWPTV